MYKLLLTSVLALGVANAASAQSADAPAWTGPYGGLQAGYGLDDGTRVKVGGGDDDKAGADDKTGAKRAGSKD